MSTCYPSCIYVMYFIVGVTVLVLFIAMILIIPMIVASVARKRKMVDTW